MAPNRQPRIRVLTLSVSDAPQKSTFFIASTSTDYTPLPMYAVEYLTGPRWHAVLVTQGMGFSVVSRDAVMPNIRVEYWGGQAMAGKLIDFVNGMMADIDSEIEEFIRARLKGEERKLRLVQGELSIRTSIGTAHGDCCGRGLCEVFLVAHCYDRGGATGWGMVLSVLVS
jgi:hypothetical protein